MRRILALISVSTKPFITAVVPSFMAMRLAGPRIRRLLLLVAPLILPMLVCCAAQSRDASRDAAVVDVPGPTMQAKVAGGYELKNRRLRVLLDPHTGDVIFFGERSPADVDIAASTTQPSPGTESDAIGSGRFQTLLNGVAPALDGYVEARDDQTWEFLGDDPQSHTRWRKIYCLDGDRLMASFLVDNQTGSALPVIVSLAVAIGPSDKAVPSAGDGPPAGAGAGAPVWTVQP
jgi:hypothetical protein